MKLSLKKHVLLATTVLAASAVVTTAQAAYVCTGVSGVADPSTPYFNGDLTDPNCDLDDVNTALGTTWTAADIIGSKTNWDEVDNPGVWFQDEFGLGTLTITDFTPLPDVTSGTWTLTGG